jgi:ABC-type multidrug transport system fused ATPase/permease subunit
MSAPDAAPNVTAVDAAAEASVQSSPATAVEGPPAAPFFSLFRFADNHDRAALLLVLLCALFSGAVIPLTSLVLGQLLNGSVDASGYGSRVDTAALRMTLLGVACFLSLGGGVLLSFWTSARQAARLRRAYARALLRQDAAWGDKHPLPAAAARLTEDSVSVAAGMGDKLFLVLSGIAQFVGSFALAFAVSSDAYRLALTLLLIVPFAVGAVMLLFAFVSGLSGTTDDAYSSAGGVLVESLGLLRTVVALGGEAHECSRYDAHLATAEAVGVRKGLAAGAGQGIFVFTMCAMYGLGLYAGARFIGINRSDHPDCGLTGEEYQCFSGGTVVQVLFAIVGGVFALGIVAPNVGFIAGARTAAARLFEVIDRVPPIDALGPDGGALPPTGDTPDLSNARIVFEDVHFRYPSRAHEPVLRGVSFTVEPGRCLALVGPSGSGKSSVIALLARLYDPDAGRITINGFDLKDIRVSWLRAHLALVSQEPQLLPGTVLENISPTASAAEAAAAATAADIHAFVSGLPQGYDTLVTSSRLSGGQKQRLCIARALVRSQTKSAPVLLLDEATSALDSASEARIAAALAAGREGVKPTTVMVAHRLSTVKASADTVVVMEGGRVVETGAHETLVFAGGLYARLWAIGTAPSAAAPSARAEQGPTSAEGRQSPTLQSSSPPPSSAPDACEEAVSVNVAAASPTDWTVLGAVPWRRAWAIQAPQSGWVAAGIALTVISGALLPAFAVLMQRFVVVFYEVDVDAMVRTAAMYLGIFFAVAVFMLLVNAAQGYAFAAFGEPFLRQLRGRAFHSILAQGVSFLDAPSRAPALLAARLGLDASKLRLALGARLGEKISSLSTLVFGLCVSFYASWQLTLLVCVLGPFVILAADAENRVTYGTEGERAKEDLAAAVGLVGDTVAAIRVVHAFGLEPRVLERFGNLLDAGAPLAARRAATLGLGYGASQFSQVVSMAVIFKAGLALSQAGASGGAPDKVFLVFFAFQFAAFGLPNLTSLAADIAAIKSSLRAFFGIISTVPAVDASGEAAAAWATGAKSSSPRTAVSAGRIELRDVVFSYPSRPGVVLNGASLVIEPGQTAAIIGPSGCGKSSIVALLLRLYDVASGAENGAVYVDGVDTRDLPPRALRDAIGWVSQEGALFDESIEYNIAYGRSGGNKAAPSAIAKGGEDADAEGGTPALPPTPADVVEAAVAARAEGFIGTLRRGFHTRVGVGGSALSGGQRQRIVLARALCRSPRILLLDEATAALDNVSEREVQASIDGVLEARRTGGAEQCTTTIIVAHRLSTIRGADVIFAMRDGRVEEKGTFDELLGKRGLFYSLAKAQGLCE